MAKFGQKIYRYKSLSSTNDLARVFAEKGEPEGTVVLAEGQKQGRGKWKRHWISPEGGGIWLSMILRPELLSKDAAQITLMAALVVVKALKNYLNLEGRIKWPNDILIKGKKIGGILTEMKEEKGRPLFVIVGIGLNTDIKLEQFPGFLRKKVTSVKQEFFGRFSREKLTRELIKEMEDYYSLFKQEGFLAIRQEWKDFSATLGKQIEVDFRGQKVFGLAVGLSESGTLLLRRDSGIIEELSGSDIRVL